MPPPPSVPTLPYALQTDPARAEPAAIPATVRRVAVADPDEPVVLGRMARWLTVLPRMLVLLLTIGTGLAAVSAVRGVVAQGDWMYSDGVQLYHVMRIRDGFSPYPNFAESPFLALVYWPVYLWVAGMLARLGGLGTEGTLYVTRLLPVLGALGAAACISALAAASGARRTASLTVAALFVTAYVVHPWAYAARADLPALGLVLVGFLLVVRSERLALAAAAGLLMALGFGCKQTFIVGVGTAGLVLLWRREWLRLVAMSAAWMLTVGAIAVVMEVSSGGLFFYNTVASNLLPLRVQTMLDHVSLYVSLSLPLLLLAAMGWPGAPAGPVRSAVGPVRLYLVLAAVTSLVTVSRAGSYYNNLIEVTAILSILAGLGLERCLAMRDAVVRGEQLSRWSPVLAMAVLAVAVGGAGLPLAALGFKALNPPDRGALVEVIRAAPGPVLTEKDALAVVLAGKEPVGGDPLGAGLLARQGKWNPEPLNQLVRSRWFALIVLDRPMEESAAFDEFAWWPPETPEVMQQYYRFERRLGAYHLYVPKLESAEGGRR